MTGAAPQDAPHHVVVMGVSGTGKSTIGTTLSQRLGGELVEGDAFHPRANVEKMAAGQALDDDDRRPWLQALAREISRLTEGGRTGVVACSALRRAYRDQLREGDPRLFFVHLHTDYDVLLERMQHRSGHFMPPSLLRSQFETLEPLEADEVGVTIDVRVSAQVVAAQALAAVAAAGMQVREDAGGDVGAT